MSKMANSMAEIVLTIDQDVRVKDLCGRMEVIEQRLAGLPAPAAATALRIVDQVDRSERLAYNYSVNLRAKPARDLRVRIGHF
jgi:hypothetical protein